MMQDLIVVGAIVLGVLLTVWLSVGHSRRARKRRNVKAQIANEARRLITDIEKDRRRAIDSQEALTHLLLDAESLLDDIVRSRTVLEEIHDLYRNFQHFDQDFDNLRRVCESVALASVNRDKSLTSDPAERAMQSYRRVAELHAEVRAKAAQVRRTYKRIEYLHNASDAARFDRSYGSRTIGLKSFSDRDESPD